VAPSNRIVCALAIGAGLAHALGYWFVTSDDAFISLRYASHLAAGQGLLYNPGQPPVEGFSNPAFVLLAAFLVRIGLPALAAAKLIGLAALVASLWAVGALADELCDSHAAGRARVLAMALLAASPFVAFWGVAGLETLLHTALVTVTTLALVRERRGVRRRFVPWLAASLVMSRPEGLLLAIAIAALDLVTVERRGPVALAWATGFALPVALLLGARWWYFGEVAPNTYHAKVFWGADTALVGLGYVAGFLRDGGWWLLVSSALALAVPLRGPSAVPVLAILAAQTGFLIAVGGDAMPGYRFVVPVYPLLCASTATGLARVTSRSAPGLSRAWAIVLVAILCAGSWLGQVEGLGRHPRRYWLQHEGSRWQYVGRTDVRGTWLEGHQRSAEFIRDRAGPLDVLVVTEAGLIPYVTGLQTVDLLGLNDRTVSRFWQQQAEEQARATEQGIPMIRYWAYEIADFALSGRPRWMVLDGRAGADSGFHPRLDIGHWLMRHPEWSAYREVFRARVYDGRAAGLGPDRIDVVFERSG
jgi:hypothetical protein